MNITGVCRTTLSLSERRQSIHRNATETFPFPRRTRLFIYFKIGSFVDLEEVKPVDQ